MTTIALDRTSDLSPRVTFWACLLSGAALVVDCVTITVINRAFGVLDDVLFIAGFVGMWVSVVAFAVMLSRGRRGRRRLAVGVAAFVVVGLALGALSTVMDQLGRHVFSDANVGLHGEWSFFTIGVCLLGIAAWSRQRV